MKQSREQGQDHIAQVVATHSHLYRLDEQGDQGYQPGTRDTKSESNVTDGSPGNRLTCDIVFDYVCAYIEIHDYPPSMREISQACRLSVTAVRYNLDKLEAWGWLMREPGTARSLRILRTKKGKTENLAQE